MQSIASYPHINIKSRYYYCFHFIDEKNEAQRKIKRVLYLPGEIIKTIDLEVASTIMRKMSHHLLVIKPKSDVFDIYNAL